VLAKTNTGLAHVFAKAAGAAPFRSGCIRNGSERGGATQLLNWRILGIRHLWFFPTFELAHSWDKASMAFSTNKPILLIYGRRRHVLPRARQRGGAGRGSGGGIGGGRAVRPPGRGGRARGVGEPSGVGLDALADSYYPTYYHCSFSWDDR